MGYFKGISKEYFAVVDSEDTAVVNLAALAGGKLLNAARAVEARKRFYAWKHSDGVDNNGVEIEVEKKISP